MASLARIVASLARTVTSLAPTVAARVSTRPLHLLPGFSTGFTRRARSASLRMVGWMVGWGEWDEISKTPSILLYFVGI